MATKRRELEGLTKRDVDAVIGNEYFDRGPVSTLGKCALDEPVFIIVAHDRCSVGAIRDWAERARKVGAPEEKWRGAMDAALAFEAWQEAHPNLVKDPA